jgi:hypothetical protein
LRHGRRTRACARSYLTRRSSCGASTLTGGTLHIHCQEPGLGIVHGRRWTATARLTAVICNLRHVRNLELTSCAGRACRCGSSAHSGGCLRAAHASRGRRLTIVRRGLVSWVGTCSARRRSRLAGYLDLFSDMRSKLIGVPTQRVRGSILRC